MVKYMGPIIAVDEIAPSRFFYEQLLGQKVKYDFGQNVTFEGDFAIHLRFHLQELLGDRTDHPVTRKAHNGELTFGTDEIEGDYQRLKQGAVEFIHGIQEQPWGQRVMRLYDPDGHIVEIGEAMEAVVRHLHGQGLSIEQIGKKTAMPREFIEGAVQERHRDASQTNGG